MIVALSVAIGIEAQAVAPVAIIPAPDGTALHLQHEMAAFKPAPFFGIASYYASRLHGRRTASGEVYDRNRFTAACNVLPLGTLVEVTNLRNGRSVQVRINDRLSIKVGRLVDLSRRAADYLKFTNRGLTRVKMTVVR